MKVSNFKDGLLGLIDHTRGYTPHLLVGLGVFSAFLVAWLLWAGVTTVEISNQSRIDLGEITIVDKSLEGVETPLWQIQVPSNQTTYRFTYGCCDRQILRYKIGTQSHDVHCRHSDWEEFPDFSMVFPENGPAFCPTCRWCLEGGVWK